MTIPAAHEHAAAALEPHEERPARRAYVAPALSELGSVEELTRGSGSFARDARTTTRRVQ